MVLHTKDGDQVACIKSHLTNGKSMNVPSVTYVAAGVAGAALLLSGLSAISAAGHPGASTSSPGFGDVMMWFHSMATNGMLSVSYPSLYRSFTSNFAFSTGLIPWARLQLTIDNFRSATGGNLTADNYKYLKNATLVYSNGNGSSQGSIFRRDMTMDAVNLAARELSTSFNGSNTDTGDNGGSESGAEHFVSGIEAYVEKLMIPRANTFMTVLLIFAIVVAAIAVGILLVKVVLELWALYGNFPKKLRTFRKDYWGLMGRTITNLILILYGIWVLYCIYQLSSGDSWAAKALAAFTLLLFTAILLFFTIRISYLARKYKRAEGDSSSLFENKETWRKYSLFYDNYKRDYWWIFMPLILYMFARGCILAAADGHGLIQSAGQLIVEALLLVLLLWDRPYVTRSNQWITITIHVVRVLSVACVLVFVEELGFSQTTKTITGVVLVAVQAALTGLLAILIAVNAIIICVRKNPHAKQRKAAGKPYPNHSSRRHADPSTEKMNRDVDDLTPLDARESLLMENQPRKDYSEMSRFNFTGPYQPYHDQGYRSRHSPTGSTDRLVDHDVSFDNRHGRSTSRDSHDRNSLEGHPPPPGYGIAL